MDTVTTIAQLALGAAALLALVRAVRGPTLADLIIALDLVLLLLAGGVAAHGARTGTELFVPLLIVVALVAFAGTVIVARFIEWRDTK
jgi:multicomponent Na+:H+ antiporter subunit F